MLDWILVLAAIPPLAVLHRRSRQKARHRREAKAALAFLGEPIAPMSVVQPPRAANDDVMAPVYDEVERELRRAGYLR